MKELFINTLQSFNELTEDDQKKCKELFERPLHPKMQEHKYMKFTQEILDNHPNESQEKPYFLTFQTITLHISYSALIFSLCGVFESFHLVIYVGVLEDEKVQEKEVFISDILNNLITNELPKLKSFTMKFVLLHNNVINRNVVKILSDMEPSICSQFLFIADSGYWRYMHNPYAQNTCFEILNTSISAENIEEIFNKYRKIANTKNLQYLEQFLTDFYNLSRVLLADKVSITLHLCTLDRVDNFEIIIHNHMKAFKEHIITRKLIFQLLRALIIIYDR
ncbi:LOW QUALITY PROTEIN: uncharacterized protein Dere_GG26531 [Drosophila erecta]|uniref:Uncharacterized protein n=1 Tax=Drosophila erecta TaxID=7220 RepID=A0A0Q5UES1_DROER|nr:LOW QUALITY PROTEIN: uncharacterized protein Dere_GG26531 [Drosophila erecta]